MRRLIKLRPHPYCPHLYLSCLGHLQLWLSLSFFGSVFFLLDRRRRFHFLSVSVVASCFYFSSSFFVHIDGERPRGGFGFVEFRRSVLPSVSQQYAYILTLKAVAKQSTIRFRVRVSKGGSSYRYHGQHCNNRVTSICIPYNNHVSSRRCPSMDQTMQ